MRKSNQKIFTILKLTFIPVKSELRPWLNGPHLSQKLALPKPEKNNLKELKKGLRS